MCVRARSIVVRPNGRPYATPRFRYAQTAPLGAKANLAHTPLVHKLNGLFLRLTAQASEGVSALETCS